MLKENLDKINDIKNKYQSTSAKEDIDYLINIIEQICYPLYFCKLKDNNKTIPQKSYPDPSLCSFCRSDLKLREIYNCTSKLTTEVWYCYDCENIKLWFLGNGNLNY